MSAKYWAKSVNGGTSGAMDAIDPTDTDGSSTVLVAGDICKVEEDHATYTYRAVNSSSTEAYPDVILPDAGGSWHWELINRVPRSDGMMDAVIYANTPGAF